MAVKKVNKKQAVDKDQMSFSIPDKLQDAVAGHIKKISERKPGDAKASGLVGGICCNA